jgi:hypothetical protein
MFASSEASDVFYTYPELCGELFRRLRRTTDVGYFGGAKFVALSTCCNAVVAVLDVSSGVQM